MDDWRSYDRVAETYGRIHAPRLAQAAQDLVRLLELGEGQVVLDIGAGTGAASGAIRNTGAVVVAADPSPAMLEVARRDHGDLPVVAAQAIDLPFPPGTFDAVVGNFVLAHFTKVDTALFDLLRVTKPGGRLGFSAWQDGIDTFTETWLELVTSVVPREMLEPSVSRAIPNRDRFRRRATLEQVLLDAGLSRVRTERSRYEWIYARDEFVDGLATWATGRFVRSMIGDAGWASFMERAHATFAERFPDPLHDAREVLFVVGTKS
jgi:ubiquinone/menaquinone biosynthesis C-methylase UbiE